MDEFLYVGVHDTNIFPVIFSTSPIFTTDLDRVHMDGLLRLAVVMAGTKQEALLLTPLLLSQAADIPLALRDMGKSDAKLEYCGWAILNRSDGMGFKFM